MREPGDAVVPAALSFAAAPPGGGTMRRMVGRLHHVVLDRPDPHVAAATPLVLALGARRLEGDDVFADPAGHPFCLVARPGWADPIPADDPASR